MKISRFGQKIAAKSGIGRLMDDLGNAISYNQNTFMLGGGNPAHIPQVQSYFRKSMEKLLCKGSEFEKAIGNYDPPVGNTEFISEISTLLKNELGWEVKPENIALTNGSQMAFFILFNIFAGEFEDGANKKILLPLIPEYIGYSDVGLTEDLFIANKPLIEHIDSRVFKYHIDFENIEISKNIGAICVSRPTNPTGNVLTDVEIKKLSSLAAENEIPLIIDNAYGMPFPDIVFTKVRATWNKHIIYCMSLSKLGLPAVRTGIIIAREEIIELVGRINAVLSLAPGGMGAAIASDLVKTGDIIKCSREVIKPFYQQKAQATLECIFKQFNDIDFHVHQSEGAFFLWLWFPGLPISDTELYQRLKSRGVLVVPGNYFFPGLKEDLPWKNECIRVSFAQDLQTVTEGIKIIAQEVRKAYK